MADAAIEIQNRLVAAVAARQRGQLADELRLLDEALAIKPDDPIALNARGMRALADSQPRDAADSFSRAAAVGRYEPTLLMNLSSAACSQDTATTERSALERALELDRFHFMALL